MEMQVSTIENKIYEIRGRRVMMDFDLAEMYEVETRRLNEAVKRNIRRFPPDFMFQLTDKEFVNLKSQIATSSWGGTRKLPHAFTEQGVAMLSGLLNSEVAIAVNIIILRAFVAMREYISATQNVTEELLDIRKQLRLLERADEDNLEAINDLSEDVRKDIDNLYDAIGALSVRMPKIEKSRRPIGFKRGNER